MTGPLEGIRVIEICSAISGPFATKLLGDMGAEVIKVENTGTGAADRSRDLPYDRHGNDQFTWRFLNYNTSKGSIGLDLKSERGKEILEGLIVDADVVLENMRPGSMERLGFGWERMYELNPRLVYCSIKGYGSEGPYTNLPALDTLMQGITGFATQVGAGTEPDTMEVLVIDMMSGLYAAWSTTAALYEREHSGEGQRVDVSMLDAAVSMLGHQLAEYTAGQHHDDYEPAYDDSFAPNGYYATADGFITLFISEDHWPEFVDAIDRPAWADPEHRYGTNEKRLDRREALADDLEAVLADRTTDEWMRCRSARPSSTSASTRSRGRSSLRTGRSRSIASLLSASIVARSSSAKSAGSKSIRERSS